VSKRPWGPTGIYPPPSDPVVLSDQDWELVEATFKKHMRRRAPAKLRDALNDALRTYVTVDQGIQLGSTREGDWKDRISAPATPKHVRANLRGARQSLLRLLDRFNDLDGNSRSLIAEAHDGGVDQLYECVNMIGGIISAAEKLAGEYPTTRAGIIDHSSQAMGFMLAKAIRHFCGEEKLTGKREGLYHHLLLILFAALGKPHEDRSWTMRGALKHYRARASEGTLGPPLPWEKSEAAPGNGI
jgi:hypothetical protein